MSATCVMDDVANLCLFGGFWFNFLMYHVKHRAILAGHLLVATILGMIIPCWFKTLNCSQRNVPKNAPAHLIIRQIEYYQVQHRFEQPNHTGHPVKQERREPWCCLDWNFNVTAMKPMAMPWDANYIRPNCGNEAAKHIELGPHGAADTHPVSAISDGTGDLASGDTGNVAPDVSIPTGNVAPCTSIRFGNSTSTEHGEEELHRLPTPTEALGNISVPTALTGLLLYSRAIISMLLLGYLGAVLVLAGGYLVIGFANITGYSSAMISMLFILRPCATEAAKHIELGPHGAADTHPVAPIDDGTGDLASGGIDTGAPDSSIPIGNVALDTSIPIGNPSDSDGDSTGGDIGTGDPSDPDTGDLAIDDGTGDLASGGIDTGAPNSSIPIGNVAPDTSIPIGNPSDSDGDSTSGDIETGDPSDPDGDSNGGGIGNRPGRGPCRDFTKGILFLFMGMIAEFAPNLMQLAGSTQKHNLKLLLWGINMSAAGCFLSSCCGLLGEVMRMVDCRLFSRSALRDVQKISLVAASTFMMAAMVLVFIFISEAMV